MIYNGHAQRPFFESYTSHGYRLFKVLANGICEMRVSHDFIWLLLFPFEGCLNIKNIFH